MLTKRQLLQYVGSVAGAAGVYRTMAALGMLGVSSLTGCSSGSAVSQSVGDGKRVVILGAGIAGLVAAYELDKLGYDCTILEAATRAGGRSLTIRGGDVMEEFGNTQRVDFDADDHLYANMGPARIPYHHETILGYCKELGVPLEVFVNDNRGAFFQSRGWNSGNRVTGRELHAAQRGYISELLAKAVNRGALDQELTMDDKEKLLGMLDDFSGPGLNEDYEYTGSGRAGYDGMYVNKGLGGTMPVPPLALREVLGFNLPWFFLHWGHDLDQQATLFQPVGGMDKIVDAFTMKIGHLIRYESVVEDIMNQSGGGVRIAYSYRGAMMESFVADFAISTIPATVLNDIPNNFSTATQDAIADTPYDSAVKLAFQTRSRFWEDPPLSIYGGISWTNFGGDRDVTQIWYPANDYHQDKGIILGAYIFGVPGFDQDSALSFAAMSPSQRVEAAIQAGERIHPGYYRNNVEAGVSRAWSEVPFQKGSWPDFGKVPVAQLTEPDGAVYFAGDLTSALSGWQEGSALSALAAVDAIQMRAATGA
ncbi:MAG: FAD-dependent oxidoreductase [Candidatus Tectomicrobia bacterium]|nr:FAD-dependent oxidoreductase [Candidatus Tectomicrobia bacterium]